MSTLKSALFWTTALVGANYLADWAVVNTVSNAATNVADIISTGASSATPLLAWPIAPAIAAGASAWNATGEFAERWLWGVAEKGALNYGVWAGILTATGIIAAPAVGTAAAVWLWMYWTRQLFNVAKWVKEDPWSTYRWAPEAAKSLFWKGNKAA